MASHAEIANDLAAKSKVRIRNAQDKDMVSRSMMRGADAIRELNSELRVQKEITDAKSATIIDLKRQLRDCRMDQRR